MFIEKTVLTGRHVRLEPLSEAHIPGLEHAGSDPAIWSYMPYGDMSAPGAMAGWVRLILRRQAEGTDLPYAVIHLASGQVAGATRFMEIRPSHRGLEIGGSWYAAEYRRTAVNTEAKYLMLSHAFEVARAIRVQFKADSRNERSIQAIERLGAVREGTLRNHLIMPDGVIRHSVYFSILDVEWPDVRERLEKLMAGY